LKGITFTYPPANASLTNASFEVAGKLPASLTFTQMTCQLFLQSNGITSAPQPVTLDPAAAKWAFPVSNLTAGSYKILAVAYDTAGKARLISENFNLLARLSVTAQPPSAGSVTAGLNGRFLEVGRSYYISAIPKRGQIFTYWTGPASSPSTAATTFVMSPNTVLTANFISNAFPSVAGTYTGLFINPINVSPTNSGFISVTTTGTGLLSGQLSFPSRAYPLEWKFPYTGFIDLSGAGLDGTVLEVALDLDLTNGTDAITGYVAGRLRTGQYLWISDLVLYRGVTRLSGSNAPNAGRYALLLQSETNAASPVAAGYATVSLAGAGAVALGGFLPDNTAIARAARISKDGIWPMYMSRYGGKGMIIGWETNTPAGTCNGQLFWFNPSIGYVTNLVSTGAAFSAPVADTQYQIILAGGTTNALTVGATRQFAPESPIVRISLLPSGLLSGVVDFKDNKLSFKGAFVSPSTGGAGFILGSGGQTYGFEISPQP
jgi:hypothetical protein